VQSAEHDVRAALPVVIGNSIRPVSIRNVDLNNYEIRLIVQVKLFYVLILQRNFKIGVEVSRERGQSEGREQRVFNRSPKGTGGFGQSRQNQFDAPDEADSHNGEAIGSTAGKGCASGKEPRPKKTCQANTLINGRRSTAQPSSAKMRELTDEIIRRIQSRETNRARNNSPE
jgi:hypothetical protein